MEVEHAQGLGTTHLYPTNTEVVGHQEMESNQEWAEGTQMKE